MICTGYNKRITELLAEQQVLWKLKLESGLEIWSDFDVSGLPDPWARAKQHCYQNNENIISISVIAPGQPEMEVFQDENGLNNIFVVRGIAKSIVDDSETVYSFVSFGKLEPDNKLHIKRFVWPECSFLESEEVRELTEENRDLLYVKKENREQ